MLANCVNGPTAARTLASKKLANAHYGLELYYRDYKSLIFSNYVFENNMYDNVNFNLKDYVSKYLALQLVPFYNQIEHTEDILEPIIDKNFKYCPVCIKNGYHAIYHQFAFLNKCLIHNIELVDICPFCKEKIKYGIIFTSLSTPFCCSKCNKSLLNIQFEYLVGEWLNDTNKLSFQPFSEYKNINPLIIIAHNDCKFIKSKKIKNIISDMFFNNKISNKPDIVLNNNISIDTWCDNKLNKHILYFINRDNDEIVTKCYFISLMNISRYIRKSKQITRKNITDLKRRSYGRYYKYTVGCKKKYYYAKFSFNACVYYFWKRNLEYHYYDYKFYHVNAINNEKYYFNPDNEIFSLLKVYKKRLQHLNTDRNIVINILARISSELFLNKYELWEKHIREKLSNQDIIKFMDNERYEKLGDNEIISKEFLILFDDKNNYNIYTE